MTGKTLTCLLIDDDEDDHDIFKFALSEIDKEIICLTANNCYEGLQKLREAKAALPDYIFLDLNMPGMNGKECLMQIKNIPALQSIPVIIFSTSSVQADITQAKNLGAFDFISKPPSISGLVNLLRTIIKY